MNPRELVILLLGFAIIAVILRGLFVAFQARKGQIRLAIDKNIPQDIDLDALELSELPSGGARVVGREGEEEEEEEGEEKSAASAVTTAKQRAHALDLGANAEDSDTIPVLMDAVELKESHSNLDSGVYSDDTRSDFSDSDDCAGEQFTEDDGEQLSVQGQQGDEDQLLSSEYSSQAPEQDPLDVDIDGEIEPQRESEADSVLFDYDEGTVVIETTAPHFSPNSADEELWGDNEEQKDSDSQIEADGTGGFDALASVKPDYPVDKTETEASLESEDEYEHEAEDDAYTEATALDIDSVAHDEATETERVFQEELDQEAITDEFEGGVIDERFDEGNEQIAQAFDDQSPESVIEESFEAPDEADELQDEYDDEAGAESRQEPAVGSVASFEEGLEEFSMSAGDRIGGAGDGQSNLFATGGESDKGSADTSGNQVKKESVLRKLFSTFSRRSKDSAEIADDAPVVVEEILSKANPADNAQEDDLIPEQLDIVEDGAALSPEHFPDEEDIAEETESTEEAHAATEPTEVIVISVMAQEGYAFVGHDLLEVLVTSGLKFGDMSIFHKRLGNDPNGAVVFSVANVLNPGTFDLNKMDEFTTQGVSLFLALPSPLNNLDALEQMLTVASNIRDTLQGDLRDDHRNLMTAQTIEHYRQRVRDFELRRLKAAGSRG